MKAILMPSIFAYLCIGTYGHNLSKQFKLIINIITIQDELA